jgi:hypothetical protein
MSMHRHILFLFVALFMSLLWSEAALAAAVKNGFQLEPGLVKPASIRRGGPPRDGIPAIVRPRFVAAQAVDFLTGEDRVLGVDVDGVPRAYAVKILDWHEVVNDWSQATDLLVTYCPLCGSGMAFHVDQDVFGVSGLLYNSDVLLYDTATESLWSQIMGKAITGSRIGSKLSQVPVVHTTWGQWLARHPNSLALSPNTGRERYQRNASYVDYENSRSLWQPVTHRDRRFHPKEWVLGVELGGVAKAYPFSILAEQPGAIEDTIDGRRVVVHFADDSAWAEDQQGNLLTAVRLFWFAWYAFHPDTAVYDGPEAAEDS